jgi:hypothetical protein
MTTTERKRLSGNDVSKLSNNSSKSAVPAAADSEKYRSVSREVASIKRVLLFLIFFSPFYLSLLHQTCR